mmetsp:Transcript_978/g.2153  ORF Transcript_978/g.2153 Transcript_978/m.2153 type:complete len:345 (+) Transcript_978:2-1036(+)
MAEHATTAAMDASSNARPRPSSRLQTGRAALAVTAMLGCAVAVVCMVVRMQRAENTVTVLDGITSHLDSIDRFRRDQEALDHMKTSLSGIRYMEETNIAKGDDLAAQMQLHDNQARHYDAATAAALRDSDAAIQAAGLSSGRGSLLGNIRGERLYKEMALGQTPDAATHARFGVSLESAVGASERELARVAAGQQPRAPDNMGLAAAALRSVTSGMADGLSVQQADPLTGLTSGQLRLVSAGDATRIANKELRSVAAGRMSEGASLVGLGHASFHFPSPGSSRASSSPSQRASSRRVASHRASSHPLPAPSALAQRNLAGVEKRTIAQLKQQLRDRLMLIHGHK